MVPKERSLWSPRWSLAQRPIIRTSGASHGLFITTFVGFLFSLVSFLCSTLVLTSSPPLQKNGRCNRWIATASIPLSGGLKFNKPEPQKEEFRQKSSCYATQCRASWTLTVTPSKRHMIPFKLVSGFWAQTLDWRHQEMRYCAIHVATSAILWVYDRACSLNSIPTKNLMYAKFEPWSWKWLCM